MKTKPRAIRFSEKEESRIERYAQDDSLPVPRQVLSERFVSPEPIYGMQAGSQELRTYLERTTPMEFRCHNVFLGDNALSRA